MGWSVYILRVNQNNLNITKNSFDFINDIQISSASGAVGIFIQEADTIIRTLSYPWIKRYSPQHLDAHLFRKPLRSAGSRLKYLRLRLTARTYKARHIFHKTQDSYANFITEIDFSADILESYLLGCCNQYRSVYPALFEVLYNAEMFVRSAWWCVDDKIIQGTPVNVFEKLGDEAIFLGPRHMTASLDEGNINPTDMTPRLSCT